MSVVYSTVHVPDEWLQFGFSHQPKKSYELCTDSCDFSFACHDVLSVEDDHIVLYGQLWDPSESENYGWRIIYIDKNQKKGMMHIIKTEIQPLKLTDSTFKAQLIARLSIGALPSDSFLYI